MPLARIVSTVLFILTLGAATAVHADDESSANRLLVSSVQLIKQYAGIPAGDPEQHEARLTILRDVWDNLASIVDDYPGSSLAVEIVTEERAKTLVLADVEAEITRIECRLDVEIFLQKCFLPELLEFAKSIESKYSRVYALTVVAQAQVSGSDIEGARQTVQQALETAQSIEDEYERAIALTVVEQAQVSGGDIEGARQTLQEALETAKSIEGNNGRVYALGAVAQAQVSGGDIEGARQTVQQALETAKSIEDEYERSIALGAVAEAQASAGDVAEALETAQSIRDEIVRAIAFGAVAEALPMLK